jgi:Ring finger domain
MTRLAANALLLGVAALSLFLTNQVAMAQGWNDESTAPPKKLDSVQCRLDTEGTYNVQYSTFLQSYIEISAIGGFANNIIVFDDDYMNENPIIPVKVCWCAQYFDRAPEYCPLEFDACRVEGVDRPITCFQESQGPGSFLLGFWFICIFWYLALLYAVCCSEHGRFVFKFLQRKLCLSCSNDNTEREFLQRQVAVMIQDDPERATWILRSALLRERRSRQPQQQDSYWPWRNPRATADDHRNEPATPTSHEDNTMREWQQLMELRVKNYSGSGTGETETDTGECQQHDASEDDIEIEATSSHTLTIATATQFLSNVISLNIDTAQNAAESSDVTCAICLCPVNIGDRIGDIPCGHIYCVECLKGWLKRKNHCPLCMRGGLATPTARSPTSENSVPSDETCRNDSDPEAGVASPRAGIASLGLIVSMPSSG